MLRRLKQTSCAPGPRDWARTVFHCLLECKVKWVLGSITTNKASEGYGISVELFHILKDDAVKVLHSICQEIWKTQQWQQEWKRSIFIPIPKKGNAKECSNCHIIALISHTSKSNPQSSPSQASTVSELPDVQAGFRKGRGIRGQIANIHWIIKKTRKFQKSMYFCFIDYAKALWLCGSQHMWKILQEMGISDHVTWLMRNLHAGQEATFRIEHGTPVPNRERSMSRLYIVTLLI